MPGAGEIVKTVRTRFQVDGLHDAVAQTRTLERRMDSLAAKAATVRRRMSAMIAPLATAGVAGVGLLVKSMIDVGREAENSQLRITSLLLSAAKASNLQTDTFGSASKAAAELRKRFAELAIASPTTADAISASFEGVTFKLSQAGVALSEQAEIARDIATRESLDKTLQPGVIAKDVKQILSGQFSVAEISTTQLAGATGREAAKLAKEGKLAQSASLIKGALALSQQELEAFGNSFDGKLATITDRFTKLRRVGAAPLMDFLISKMDELNDWLENNAEEAENIARAIGEGVVEAVQAVIDLVQWLGEHWDSIVAAAELFAKVWIASVAVQGMATLVGSAAKLVGLLKTASKIQIGGGGGLGGGKGGGKLGAAAGVLGAVGVGLGVGEVVGGAIAERTTGFTGGLFDIFDPSFKPSAEQTAINAQFLQREREHRERVEAARAATKTSRKEESVLDRVIDPADIKGKRRGGKGRKRAVIRVERAEIRADSFDVGRLAGPLAQSVRSNNLATRPQSSTFGLGSVRLANGG